MSTFQYLLQRFAYALPQFFLMTVLVFLLLRAAPGSPVDFYLANNPFATAEHIEAMERRMGLDLPLWQQYGIWIGGVLRGDLGESLSRPGQPVSELLGSRLVNSLILSIGANILSFAIAIPVGIAAAIRRGTWVDGAARFFSLVGYSMPSFWLALLAIQLFAVQLQWLPAAGFVTVSDAAPWHVKFLDGARHSILPIAVLGVIGAALTSRVVRSNFLDVLHQDYVRTARSKGVVERRVYMKHALRNALLPVVTVVGVQVGYLFASATVTETVFAWPGIGREVVLATTSRDYPMVMGITVLVGAIIILVNLVTDLLYASLDPRIRFS